jgi:hypothetical protein
MPIKTPLKTPTITEREALSLAAAVLHPTTKRRRRDSYASVRDVAASACGMIHRDGYLLTRLPHAVLTRDRTAMVDGAPCLLNGFREVRPPIVATKGGARRAVRDAG